MIASGVGQEKEKAHGANASFGGFFFGFFFLFWFFCFFFFTSFLLSSLVDLCSNSQAGTAKFRGTLGQHV